MPAASTANPGCPGPPTPTPWPAPAITADWQPSLRHQVESFEKQRGDDRARAGTPPPKPVVNQHGGRRRLLTDYLAVADESQWNDRQIETINKDGIIASMNARQIAAQETSGFFEIGCAAINHQDFRMRDKSAQDQHRSGEQA